MGTMDVSALVPWRASLFSVGGWGVNDLLCPSNETGGGKVGDLGG